MVRTIALYLPQFHEIPENNEWWGHGFTEWVNVKKAVPLFEGHQQPRIPLDNNYYDLSDVNVMRWQTELAKKYGIYGFCFYHYWFNGKKLLEKPVDNYLEAKDIDFPFCICWANEHWTNKWATENDRVLIEQKYGGREQWKEHFDYLLPFFKDSRYIYQDGKPLFVLYRPELVTRRREMLEYWNQLALENGKTSTYTAENAVVDGDALVWTVTRTFRAADVGACTVKTKSISGWTAMDDAVITVSVAEAE